MWRGAGVRGVCGALYWAQSRKGFRCVPLLQPVEGLVGCDIRLVTCDLGWAGEAVVFGIIIGPVASIAGKNFPMLKLIGGVALDVPLADQCGLVSGLAQFARIGPLFGIPSGAVAQDAIGRAVFTGHKRGAARAANRVAYEGAGEEGALMR